jgi:hypothetical protein
MVIAMPKRDDDRAAVEYVREFLADIRAQLRAGAKGPGVVLRLDDDDCVKMLACLKDPPYPNSRPSKVPIMKVAILYYAQRRYREGALKKTIVAEVMERFNCSRSFAYDALKKPSK